MNKNVYKIILVTLTICCIIGGTIYYVVGWLSNFSFFPWNTGSKANVSTERETYSSQTDAFDTVKINGTVFDITIETGDDYSLTYDCVSYLVPQINIKTNDRAIEIIQPKLPHFGNGMHNNSCQMTLTVPANCSLNKVTITNNVGDIALNNLAITDASIDSDVGDVTLNNCFIDALESTVDVGDMDFTACDLRSLDASSDVGDIKIELANDITSYNIDLSSDIGSVTVNGTDYKKTFHASSKENKDRTLSISTSTGDISLHD